MVDVFTDLLAEGVDDVVAGVAAGLTGAALVVGVAICLEAGFEGGVAAGVVEVWCPCSQVVKEEYRGASFCRYLPVASS